MVSLRDEMNPNSTFGLHVHIFRLMRRQMFARGQSMISIGEAMSSRTGQTRLFRQMSQNMLEHEVGMMDATKDDLIVMRDKLRELVVDSTRTAIAANDWYPDGWRDAMGGAR